MRLRVFSVLSLGLVLALCLAWVGCSDGTGRPGTGGSLISPALDIGLNTEEPLPDNAWEQYVELHYGDDAAVDSSWTQSGGTGSDDENQATDSDGSGNSKDTGPTI